MINNTGVGAYKNQQINTMPPERLTLMLYDGAIRFTKEAIMGIENNIAPKDINEASIKAQNIIREFVCTLKVDVNPELAEGYLKLYDYIEYELRQGVFKHEKIHFENALLVLQELREALFEAMKIAKGIGQPAASAVAGTVDFGK